MSAAASASSSSSSSSTQPPANVKTKPAYVMQTRRSAAAAALASGSAPPVAATARRGRVQYRSPSPKRKDSSSSRSRSRDSKMKKKAQVKEAEPPTQDKKDAADLCRVANSVDLLSVEKLNRVLQYALTTEADPSHSTDALLKLAGSIRRVSDWIHENGQTIHAAAVRPTLKKRFVWFKELHHLAKFGLPVQAIETQLNGLIESFASCSYSVDMGWAHLFQVGGCAFTAFSYQYICATSQVHQHTDGLTVNDAKTVLLPTIREMLKVPDVPLSILLQVLTDLGRMFGDYEKPCTECDTEHGEWSSNVANVLTEGVIDATPLMFGRLQTAFALRMGRIKAIVGEWTLLTPGAPNLVMF